MPSLRARERERKGEEKTKVKGCGKRCESDNNRGGGKEMDGTSGKAIQAPICTFPIQTRT